MVSRSPCRRRASRTKRRTASAISEWKVPSVKEIRVPKLDRAKPSGTTVTIVVGSEGHTLCIHETPARKTSTFLDEEVSCLENDFKEKKIELPDEDPEIWALYVHWAYLGSIPTKADKESIKDVEYLELAKAYVLGEVIESPGFCNSVIDAICWKVGLDHSKDKIS
ncbi:uncharacterized protein DSM5745_00112 [Aspergillus mulundensis]|uniref:BTB domain-containing protein n=1 Tax=Aspergillus mulundensis TaxID=1810919 RepID=A0A3D8T2M9_9EURO|nr:hypothetical protein DSM5745_00112 [Aspergillus mulundensis]RDW92790.1 hypothetical protein DSM5745_00112 [Aspergillus mulundensis]